MSALEKLLAYQEEDKNLVQLENKLKDSDSRKKGIQAQRFLATVSETIASIEAKSQELCVSYERAINELNDVIEQNEGFDESVKNAQEEKEINYLKIKASELQKKLKDLADKVAKIEQEMNEIARQYGKLRKETTVYQDQYKKSREEYEKEKVAVEPEKKQIEAKLKVLSADIPAEVLEKYTEKRKDKRFPIVYKLDKNSSHCPACGTELSMKQIDSLKKEGVLIECENCRRLIFK